MAKNRGYISNLSNDIYDFSPGPFGKEPYTSSTITFTGVTVASYSGNKPVVICNGQVTECKDLAEAQAKAEQLAHQHQADAFVLKPVKKVAPKRDVVVTEL